MGPEQFENELLVDIAECYDDPLAFVMYAFPWGVKGSELAEQDGNFVGIQKLPSVKQSHPGTALAKALSAHG